ncbi:MAG: hypothetical protein V4506_07655 [Bacteroidota bacterium]
MLTFQRILIDLSPMFIAILIGMLVYKKLPVFYRILFFQVLIFTVVDIYGTTIPINNVLVYNISMIIEINLFFLAAYTYFNSIASKRMMFIFCSLFISLFLFDICYSGMHQLAKHAYIAGGILITGTYITILYYHFIKRDDKYNTLSLVLVSVGSIIYFAGMVPYLSIMDYFQKKDPIFNKVLFQYLMVIPGSIRYLCIAMAFFFLGKFEFKALKPSR